MPASALNFSVAKCVPVPAPAEPNLSADNTEVYVHIALFDEEAEGNARHSVTPFKVMPHFGLPSSLLAKRISNDG
jgi:hypothetical protein